MPPGRAFDDCRRRRFSPVRLLVYSPPCPKQMGRDGGEHVFLFGMVSGSFRLVVSGFEMKFDARSL